MSNWDPAEFKPTKAVVLTKVSRYEYEQLQHEKLTEKQLEEEMIKVRPAQYFIYTHDSLHHVVITPVIPVLSSVVFSVGVTTPSSNTITTFTRSEPILIITSSVRSFMTIVYTD